MSILNPGILLSRNLRKPRENGWFSKSRLVGKNGEATPRITGLRPSERAKQEFGRIQGREYIFGADIKLKELVSLLQESPNSFPTPRRSFPTYRTSKTKKRSSHPIPSHSLVQNLSRAFQRFAGQSVQPQRAKQRADTRMAWDSLDCILDCIQGNLVSAPLLTF